MLDFLRAKHSRMLVWTLLVLIVIGLAGFGVTNSGAFGSTNVAEVGGTEIPSEDYARAMDQEMRNLTQRLGRSLPMSEARQYGIDNVVLSRLVNDAALDEEARRLGLSVGDEVVAQQVMAAQAFKGPDGKFNRDIYESALANAGLRPAAFEEQLRREAARDMIASAAQSAVAVPTAEANLLLDCVGERRSFAWLPLGPEALADPVPDPTDADAQAEYAAHPDAYTLPETRHLTYAVITPDTLAPTVEVSDADLQAMYDAAGDRFNTPEKRLLDRIGFGTDAEAAAAKARLDAGEISFDALATERGLTAQDLDQGALPAERLSTEARAAVFGLAEPGIVGPVPTPLGPSIYRVNAILAGSVVPFQTARDDLRTERARKLATDEIAAEAAHIQDLLASGATIEELAGETNLEMATMAITAQSTEGLAAEQAFRDAAMAGDQGIETDMIPLADGGIAALRVDSIDAPRLQPLADVRDAVNAAWRAAETQRRLVTLADGYGDEMRGGLTFDALATRLGATPRTGGPVARSQSLPDVPAEFLTEGFAAVQGGTIVAPGGPGVLIGAVTAIEPFDAQDPANKAIVDNAGTQLRSAMSEDVLALYTNAVRDAAGVTVNRSQIDAALSRFP
jgi:peptidyl-prolyl cis-trans isomerase D